MDKYFFMEEALMEAKKALEKGEVPIGAIVVLGEDIICLLYTSPSPRDRG